MDLSVIIVNFNTAALTAQTVRSVFAATHDISFEVIVADNSDREEERFSMPEEERVRVLSGLPNRGFGQACNVASAQAAGDYLLYLNSDTIVHEGALDKCVRYLRDDPDIGVLGAKTVLEDGTVDENCKRGFPTPSAALYYFLGLDKRHPESRKYGAYHQTFLSTEEIGEVDAVSGSFLMMPAEKVRELGGFDEDYFMYGEDLDLCYRAKEKGWRVVYYPFASITHLKGQSGLHTSSKAVIKHFHDAMLIFYNKHYRKKYNIFVTAAVYCGVKLKYGLTLLKRRLSGGGKKEQERSQGDD